MITGIVQVQGQGLGWLARHRQQERGSAAGDCALRPTSTPDLSPTQSVCLCVLQVVEELADMIDDSLGLMDSAVQTANLEEQVPTRSMLRVHALPRHRGQNS